MERKYSIESFMRNTAYNAPACVPKGKGKFSFLIQSYVSIDSFPRNGLASRN
jgi:hypothetical protein